MAIYNLEYDNYPLATVIIKDESFAIIKEMVEFFDGPQIVEDKADETNLIEIWLKRLAMFILRNERAPNITAQDNDEGYCRLNGDEGITVKDVEPFECEEDYIDIKFAE